MAKYLDQDGLLYLWQKIKNAFAKPGDIPSAATATPLVDGTAAVGSSAKYAREDHVHPTDTSRAAQSEFSTVQTKVNGIASGAQVNVIETVKVNGTALTVTSKAVNVTVPTTLSALTNDGNFVTDASYVHTDNNYTTTEKNKLAAFGAASTYALKSDITGMYKYKGSVATAAALPSSGQTTGDVYNIEAESVYGGAGMNVAWNGTAWDPLGEIFSITSITNGEIDTIVAS